ncbi:ATP-binding protein [Lachnospiraceae bacterium 46-15]
MEKKRKSFYFLLTVSTLAIVCFATFFYIKQLNRTISDNIIRSISEIAEHDKTAIQTYIETCWEDLNEIHQRFFYYNCRTPQDIEMSLNLERASSRFSHVYLIAEDGTIYTDKYAACIPGDHAANGGQDFLSYFANGTEKAVARFDNSIQSVEEAKENIFYGIRLKDSEIGGKKMSALVGISSISSIRDNMVIDSFIKNGETRGHSALIDMNGDYIVNINKEIYLNKRNNLFKHLSESQDSELTNEEVRQRLKNLETFGFYHSHEGEKYRELFYFMPFGNEISLYFTISVNEEVFMEQTKTFVTMSMVMLAICIVTIIGTLLVVMRYQLKTIRASEKAKSQKEFLSNMSHEIRTPLNGLIGMNHLLLANIDDDSQKPQIKEWLKKSHSTANYLLSLVNDVLDMSKLQAGKVDIINEPLSVPTLIDEICSMQADNIKNRGVEFIIEKNLTESYIEGDATRTKQILMNIIGNAAKFTPKGKYIRFSVNQEKTDDMHVTTIYQCEDAGIGISKEYIPQIFDPFSQERNRNANGVKGTGLGMAISKLLANAMGGDITVESELHVGSTFTVTIPSVIVKDIPDYLKQHEAENTSGNNTLAADKENDCPVKVLVAEDVELNAEILLEILEMEGFETAHAENGMEAVELFSASAIGEFDIILMDMQMPVMDGCTASMEIRKMERADAKSVMIYACTANTFQEDRERALASGMNDFLTKPIDIDILLKKMEKTTK